MKKSFTRKIFIVIAISIFCSHTPNALAAMRAVFPDSKSLQPLPQNVAPNISHNVNGTTTGIATFNEPLPNNAIDATSSTDASNTPVLVESNWLSILGVSLLALLCLVLAFIGIKKFFLL